VDVQWFIFRSGRQEEQPYSTAAVRALPEFPHQVWVWREGMSEWALPGTLAEFAARDAAAPAAATVPAPAAAVTPVVAIKTGGDFFGRSRPTGAGWLYVVVLLSFLNVFLAAFTGVNMRFVFGLNFSSLIAGAPGAGADVALLTRLGAFVTSLTPISVFGLLAWNADRYRAWPFVVAIVLYAVDSILSLLTLALFDAFRLIAFYSWYQGFTETHG